MWHISVFRVLSQEVGNRKEESENLNVFRFFLCGKTAPVVIQCSAEGGVCKPTDVDRKEIESEE